MIKNKYLPIIALTAVLVVFAGDSKDHTVTQKNREFSTTEITIKPGESVVFKNDDEVTHNVFSTSKANAFTIKVQAPGASSSVDFKEEGVTDVRCAIHPKMKLAVTVKK
jgi:plastocyanin